jgi:hypothetical protein
MSRLSSKAIIAVVLDFTALKASGCTVPVPVSCGSLTCVP